MAVLDPERLPQSDRITGELRHAVGRRRRVAAAVSTHVVAQHAITAGQRARLLVPHFKRGHQRVREGHPRRLIGALNPIVHIEAIDRDLHSFIPTGVIDPLVQAAEISIDDRRHPGGRSSATTLPSFGRLPGATSATFPRSLVTDCSVAVTAATRSSADVAHSACKVMVSCSSARVTASRMRPSSGCRLPISATCAGCTNMPLTLVA